MGSTPITGIKTSSPAVSRLGNLFLFILTFDLFIDDLYGIISAIKFISKPGASRRRKAIGTHWVSQLPEKNVAFSAISSFVFFFENRG